MKLTIICAAVGALAIGAASPAQAEDFLIPGDSYLYVGGNLLLPDSDRAGPAPNADAEIGGGIDLIYGRHWVGNWYLEGRASGDAIRVTHAGGAHIANLQLGGDLQYAFGNRLSFTPFILAGLGASYNNVLQNEDDDAISAYGNLGLGFTTGPMNDAGARIRGEVRYVYDDFERANNRGMNDVRLGLGIEFPIGAVHMRETTKVVKVPVIQQVPVPPPPPVDSDHDGVMDGADKCPDTLKTAKVDATGCAVVQNVTVLQGVNFAFDSAKLSVDDRAVLDQAVKAFHGQPNLSAVIAGHTDSTGSTRYNQHLSERRANSVRDYLISHGVSAERLSVYGYGESRPVASNDTLLGQAKNRRVEFQLSR